MYGVVLDSLATLLVLGFPDLVDVSDVGMVKRGGTLCLLHKTMHAILFGGES